MSAAKRGHARGFTLPELLLVLSIVGILLAGAIPNFSSYLKAQQVISTADQFMFALNLARSEAMRRGTRVDLAARDARSWQSGWIVCVRQSGNDEVIHSHPPLPPELKVVSRLIDNATPYIAYNASGRTRTNASALSRQWGSWQFSLAGHERLIRLTLSGRARVCNPAQDSSCRFSELTTTD